MKIISLGRYGLPTAIILIVIATSANAQTMEDIGVRGGTLGVGAEFSLRVSPLFVVRPSVQSLDYNYSNSVNNINYDGKFKLGSYGLQLDLKSEKSPFFASVGVFSNDNKADLTATSAVSYTIGNNTYTPAQIGQLDSKIRFNKTAIYGGVGAQMTVGQLRLAAEGGVLFQGTPKVTLIASGPIASDPVFTADIRQEVDKTQNDIDKAKYWPALTVSARYKF